MSAKINLILDVTLFSAFLAVTNPRFTGSTIHEWLAVSLAGAVIAHLLFHWDWILRVGRDFFKKLFHQWRLNFVVNSLFFITMTGALFSGLMISESVMSTLGIQTAAGPAWRSVHSLMSDAAVIMLGIHFALHLKWVGTSLRRYIVDPVRGLRGHTAPFPAPLAAQPVRAREHK